MTEPTAGQIEGRLIKALVAITHLWDDTLSPTASGTGVGTTASKEPPAPIGVHILDTRREAEIVLSGWCLVVIEDRDLTFGPGQGGDRLATFLQRHASWLADHEAALDALAEIENVAATIDHTAHPARREWMLLGHCPLRDEETAQTCGGRVKAWPEDDDRDPACDRCGTVAVAKWWEREMLGDLSGLLTAPELVDFVRRQFGRTVKAPTIRKWVERGWIERAGQDSDGRSLYDRGAVAYALTRRGVFGGRLSA